MQIFIHECLYIDPRMKVLFLGRIISMNLDTSFFILWIAIHEQVLWECLLLIYSKTPPAADPVGVCLITWFSKLRFIFEDWYFRILHSKITKIATSNFKSFVIWLKLSKYFDNEF